VVGFVASIKVHRNGGSVTKVGNRLACSTNASSPSGSLCDLKGVALISDIEFRVQPVQR